MLIKELIKKFSQSKQKSSDTAKKRLQIVLMHDKIGTSDEMLHNLQKEIVEVISKYFEIDQTALKLDINKSENLSALVLNTPILSTKHRPRVVAAGR